MATRASRKKSSASTTSKTKHPIKIVPLHPHVRDTAAPTPKLTYRDGPLLTNVEVFCIFWGKAWQSTANASLSQQLISFFDFILTSSLIDQLAEYNVPGKTIGHGKRIGSLNLTSSEPGTSVDDSAIQQMIQAQIDAGVFPASTANTLYFLYLPPGTTVTQDGDASCQNFCGYHNATPNNVFYAVMPYPGCTGCQGGLETFPVLCSTSSHELCESITDPIPGQGWYDDGNGEIGDICAWKTKQVGAYTVQQEWSNKSSSCV
jgi:hypothetical protein